MGETDKALRRQALPFTSLPWGFTRIAEDTSDMDISTGPDFSDISGFGYGIDASTAGYDGWLDGTETVLNAVRMLRPAFGRMVECYLNFRFRASDAEPSPLTLQIAVGKFTTSGGSPTIYPDKTVSAGYIDARHALLRGKSDVWSIPAGDTLTIHGLNLMPQIPVEGSLFQKDGYVLLFKFNRIPLNDGGSNPTGQVLSYLYADGSAEVVPGV